MLAATLSPVYGIYSGYELCENEALPGREEYLDSEKYQFKERDWNAPGNIKDWITRLNQIRKTNRALQFKDNLQFYHADNDAIIFYGKMTAGPRQHHSGGGEPRSASQNNIRLSMFRSINLARWRATSIRCTIF